jgi:uncharacterized membrane protein YuzA (DUF378 family)
MCCKKNCACKIIAKILVIIGGLNWGLVGVGMFFGKNWNLVNAILGGMPTVEAIVYVLVGIAALVMIFCKCKKAGSCPCAPKAEEQKMPGNM